MSRQGTAFGLKVVTNFKTGYATAKPRVISFDEKPRGDGALINGGYFVLSPRCLDYIKGDDTVWEKEPLINLASDNQLMTYIFNGFWSPMDTLREKKQLENLINKNKAPWIKWEN